MVMEMEMQMDSVKQKTKKQYCIVRTKEAGVFAGYVNGKASDVMFITQARRLWYWSGAATLSELALRGVKNPNECKFPDPVDLTLLGVIEVIPCTPEAKKSIDGVVPWRA